MMGTALYAVGREQFDWTELLLQALNSGPQAISSEGFSAPFFLQATSPVWFRMTMDGPGLDWNGSEPGNLSAGGINYISFLLQDNSTPLTFTFATPIDFSVMNTLLTSGGSLTAAHPQFLAVFAPEAMGFTLATDIGGVDIFGSEAGESIDGGDGADFIAAGGGNDTVRGGEGNDTISGGFGNDELYGGDGDADVLSYQDEAYNEGVGFFFDGGTTYVGDNNGGVFIDFFYEFEIYRGSAQGDLFQFVTDQVLQGLQGGDTFHGGVLDYSADYQFAHTPDLSFGVVANFSAFNIDLTQAAPAGLSPEAWQAIVASLGSTQLLSAMGTPDMPNIRGTFGDLDTATSLFAFIGSVKGDIVVGTQSGDTFSGGEGADWLIGGDGNDDLSGDEGDDVLEGGTGNNTLTGGAGWNTLAYNDQSSAITARWDEGTAVNGTVAHGAFIDAFTDIAHVRGSVGRDMFVGNDADNSAEGLAGADTFDGGDGIDTYSYAGDVAAYKAAHGGAAPNKGVTVKLQFAVDGTTIIGRATDLSGKTDTLIDVENVIGSSSKDSITGSSTANLMRGGDGNDTLDGSTGIDTADFSDKTQKVTVTLKGATAVSVKVGAAVEDSIKNFENLIGGAAGDLLGGDSFANSLSGGLGDDTLVGAGGKDTLNGGDGTDYASYAGASKGVTANLAAPGSNTNDAKTDVYVSIEGLIGSGQADKLTGDANSNTIMGGGGKDTMDGGDGVDTADYSDKTKAVVLTLNGATNATVKVNGATEDTIKNFENVTGGSAGDTLTGDGQNNVLIGGGGNDKLTGGLGDDTLIGGTGKDTLDGGDGLHDVADYSAETTAVALQLTGGTFTSVAINELIEDSIRNVEDIIGGSGADRLAGDEFANRFWGGLGNDILNGGLGADTLTGGGGSDTFVFDSALGAGNVDTITDFTSPVDVIELSDSIFIVPNPDAPLWDYFAANETGTAQDGDDYILYNTKTGELSYDADANGAGAAVVFAVLTGKPQLYGFEFV